MNGLFSISYMGCHPNPIDELIFFKMVLAPRIELDDGKILTGNPDQFDGKNPWVSG